MSEDVVGEVFGDLVAIKHKNKQWILRCLKCGGLNERSLYDLRRGRVSCLSTCREEISRMAPINRLYCNYQRDARRRGREFELSIDDFVLLIRKNCFYCGSEPMSIINRPDNRCSIIYNGIDRVDNSAGYTIDNCVSCCKFCNFAKSKFEVSEFMAWLDRVRKNV